jgi:RNA polymerase sigma-70 factor (ECF subfamily)
VNSGLIHETHEPSGWENWLAAHTPALLLFARQQARTEADAQDLVQEAVVESWRRRQGAGPPPLSTVYYTIRHRAIDLARKEERRASREADFHSDSIPAWFDSTPEQREWARLLQDVMKSLPAIYREAVTLKVWGELTFAQIGEVLDIPANTAASRYRYGIADLRRRTKEICA